jgi:hypothetical protein
MPQRTPSYIESSLSQQFHYGELTAKFGEWIQEVAKRGVRPASAVATPVAF